MKFLRKLVKAYSLFAILHSLTKIILCFVSRRRVRKLWQHLPGRDSTFFATELRKNSLFINDFIATDALKDPSKDLYKLPLPKNTLLCFSPKAVEWMAKDEFNNITKNTENSLPSFLLGKFLGSKKSLFTLRSGDNFKEEHARWKLYRKAIVTMFTRTNFKTLFRKTFLERSDVLIQQLVKSEGKVVNIQELISDYTLKTAKQSLIGKRGSFEFGKSFDTAFSLMTKLLFLCIPVHEISKALLPFPFGSITPGEHLSPLYSIFTHFFLSFHPISMSLQRHRKKFGRIIQDYLEVTRENLSNKESEEVTVISKLMNDEEYDMDKKDLEAMVLVLLLGGRDTTASLISWSILEITKNLHLQEQIITEIDQTFQGRIPTLSELRPDNIPLLNALIYEMLRLHPPVPLNVKLVNKDLIYFDGTSIPKGTRVVSSPYAMGRNATIYPNPEQVILERWIPFKKPSDFEFPVFQAGPRVCPGQDMALFQVKFTLIRMLQQFTFHLMEGEVEKVSYSVGLTNAIVNDKNKTSYQLLVLPSQRK